MTFTPATRAPSTDAERIARTADRLVSAALRDGGATVHAVTGRVPVKGYAVAAPGVGVHWADPSDGPDATLARAQKWVERRWRVLSAPDTYAGSWVDSRTGDLWLDVVTLHQDRTVALRVAQSRHEIAIFDLATGTEISVDY